MSEIKQLGRKIEWILKQVGLILGEVKEAVAASPAEAEAVPAAAGCGRRPEEIGPRFQLLLQQDQMQGVAALHDSLGDLHDRRQQLHFSFIFPGKDASAHSQPRQ